MTNLPCKGCFWIEGGRCFNDRLASAHGLEKAPRLAGMGVSGLEIDDRLLNACTETPNDGWKSKSATYTRAINWMRDAGVNVVHVGIKSKQ